MTVDGPAGAIVGAISVSGPSYRLQGDVLRTTIPTVLEEVVGDLERELTDLYTHDR